VGEIFRYKRLRHSATVALVRLHTGAYHVGFTVSLGILGCETFFICDMRRASQALERRAGWTWLDSGERPNAFHGPLTFLILLCSRSGHKTGIDVAVREAIACIGQEASHQWHGKQTGRPRGRLASGSMKSPRRRSCRCSMLPMSHFKGVYER